MNTILHINHLGHSMAVQYEFPNNFGDLDTYCVHIVSVKNDMGHDVYHGHWLKKYDFAREHLRMKPIFLFDLYGLNAAIAGAFVDYILPTNKYIRYEW